MIVKLQAPLVTLGSNTTGSILVYGEGKSHLTVIEPADLPGWLRAALAREPKVYVEGGWSPDGWVFHRRAKFTPDW